MSVKEVIYDLISTGVFRGIIQEEPVKENNINNNDKNLIGNIIIGVQQMFI